MSYEIDFSERVIQDIELHKKSGNIKTLIKINKLIDELRNHPMTGTGKPEQLKHNLSGKWSRRINKKDRLVYQIEEETKTVNILSAEGHYSK